MHRACGIASVQQGQKKDLPAEAFYLIHLNAGAIACPVRPSNTMKYVMTSIGRTHLHDPWIHSPQVIG
jgi:hypothetical protein